MAQLVLRSGPAPQPVFRLSEGTLTIGRTEDNDIHIPHKTLSRHHAEIKVAAGHVYVRDLQSKNGTFVNGRKVERCELRAQDVVECGDAEFRFLADEEEDQGDAARAGRPRISRGDEADVSRVSLTDLLGQDATGGGSALRVHHQPDAERARQKLQILLKVSQVLSSPAPIDAVLQRILDLAFQILDLDAGAILMVEEGGLVPRVVRPPANGPAEEFFSRHVVSYVQQSGNPAMFADAQSDPRLGDAASVLKHSICASMCAPLRTKEEVSGVLYVDNRSVPNRFQPEDLDFLAAFANQAAIAIENARLTERIAEEAVTRNALLRFFPPATIRKIMSSAEPTLGTIETDVVALFCDISNFTELCSHLRPRQVVRFLNDYFPVIADIVFRHEGTLEKYIGDAVLALWGAPFPHRDDALRAVEAAVDMQRASQELSIRLPAEGRVSLSIHIGINYGRVAAGNIGSDRYLQYAAIGDTTNVASRIAGVAGAGEIVISESARVRLRTAVWPLHTLGPVKVKGKDEPLQLYRVGWEGQASPAVAGS